MPDDVVDENGWHSNPDKPGRRWRVAGQTPAPVSPDEEDD